MARASWRRLSVAEHTQLWAQWREGRSAGEIARHLCRGRHAIRCIVGRHGGTAPSARKRADDRLTLSHREEISRGLSVGESARCIAQRIGKHHSTISREISRNGGARHTELHRLSKQVGSEPCARRVACCANGHACVLM